MIELVKNVSTGDYGLQGNVSFKLFDQDISFIADGEATLEYVQRCAEYLNSLSDSVIQQLCEASIRYCNDFLDAIGEDPQEFTTPQDVLRLIYPSTFIVPDPKHGDEPVIHLELNCDWEVEHGMEWVIRGDQVLYVGAYNGENPWRNFSKKESWNYA